MWEFFPDKGPKLLNLFRSSGGFFLEQASLELHNLSRIRKIVFFVMHRIFRLHELRYQQLARCLTPLS